jgi:competence protein ComEA
MRAALLFVLVSLVVGAGLREWRRSHEVRFRDVVASLEAESGAGQASTPDAAFAADSAGGSHAGPGGRGHGSQTSRSAAPVPGALDPDRATAAEWERLPGIGPSLAARIVGDRTMHGPFGGPEGLLRVRGIGPRTLERLRPFLVAPEPDTLRPLHAN